MAETVEPQPNPATTATKSISVAKALLDIGQKKLSGQLTICDPILFG